MGLLTPPALDALVAAGCPACSAKKLVFHAYVDARLPIMGGEPVGRMAFLNDGEAFCDGVYEVRCGECEAALFEASICPRCHADAGLARALEATNAFPVPTACPRCDAEEVRYDAMVPVRTVHHGTRADKPRTSTEILDPGFHGFRASCKSCGVFSELRDRCPMCAAPGPVRERP